jgi:hypothetical protein
MKLSVYGLLLLFIIFATSQGNAGDGVSRDGLVAPTPARMPTIKKVNNGIFRVGTIIANKNTGFISVQGEVNIKEGSIERLACGSDAKSSGSLIKLDADPYSFQLALLMIGLEPTGSPSCTDASSGGPAGSPVEIWVSWKNEENKIVKYRGEELIHNAATSKPIEKTYWLFRGSQKDNNGVLTGDTEEAIASIRHDPAAILVLSPSPEVHDTTHIANTQIAPPKGALITFTVQALRK